MCFPFVSIPFRSVLFSVCNKFSCGFTVLYPFSILSTKRKHFLYTEWVCFWLGRNWKMRGAGIRWPPNVPSNSHWTHYLIAKNVLSIRKVTIKFFFASFRWVDVAKAKIIFFHTHSFQTPFSISILWRKKYLLSLAMRRLLLLLAFFFFFCTVHRSRFWIYSESHETTKVLL